MCFHDNYKAYTFTDGQQIRCCYDCTTFDAARALVLNAVVSTVPVGEVQRWDMILDEAGLDENQGLHNWLLFGENIQPMRALTRRRYTAVDDFEWCVKQEPFHHALPMPKALKNFCPDCSESSEGRLTKGCYLPIEHECPRVRVYDMRGRLVETI